MRAANLRGGHWNKSANQLAMGGVVRQVSAGDWRYHLKSYLCLQPERKYSFPRMQGNRCDGSLRDLPDSGIRDRRGTRQPRRASDSVVPLLRSNATHIRMISSDCLGLRRPFGMGTMRVAMNSRSPEAN